MRKNIFYFYPLTTSPKCAILYALTPKKQSRFCLQRKRSPSLLRRWPFSLFLKSFNYISFSSFVNRYFQKIFFIFPLDKAGKFLYNVCGLFLPGLFLSLSYRWSIKGRSSLEGRPFFISKSVNYSAFRSRVNAQNIRKIFYFSY